MREAYPFEHCSLLQEDAQWTPEAIETEQMRNEEERQRTHEQWERAVQRSAREFGEQQRVLAERQALLRGIQQVRAASKHQLVWLIAE